MEQAWSAGYIVDVGYTEGFYREQAPGTLRLVALFAGLRAVDTDRPFTYYELGCGNGYTTALLAAVHPHAQFVGVDFNPTHIGNARRLAEAAGLANVRFVEQSFADLVQAEKAEADIIAFHGVWSWINDENRRHILEFIRQRLKPGGFVYVSYNALPGLAQVAPLQRLLLEHGNLGAGERTERVKQSVEFAARLQQAGGLYFAASPLAKSRMESFKRLDPRYLAHEYYNDNWSLFYHADVARDMAEARLSYAGSGNFIDNFTQFALRPELAKIVAEIADPALAETVKDFARNAVFRRDVFIRGASKAPRPELEASLQAMRFALARPRAACKLSEKTGAGEVTMQAEAYAPVLDALARAPMSFEELARAPELVGFDVNKLRQGLFGMAALGNVWPALPAAAEAAARQGAARFNKAVLGRPEQPGGIWLASPVLGSGVPLATVDRVLLHAHPKPEQGVEHVRKVLGEPKEGAPLEERVKRFYSDVLPFLRQLGVTD
ncbi:MAG TPA: class I SAM-dependent methyltransferase [Burkholderiales bacterium]|nr:class I SAM-dependent methyltransferase [Burkholderiales bacterium]